MFLVKKYIVAASILAALSAVMPGSADAQGMTTVRPGGRGGSWEFYLPIVYSDKANISGQGGSSAMINADYGLGMGFGYNFNENFQLNGLFTWNSRSYEATVVKDDGSKVKYNNYLDSTTLMLNGVFYLMSGNITPFVSAGVGIAYVDTNIPTGPGTSVCWWDPVWGYVCGSYVPTKTENDLTYGAGVGVRFDLSRQFSLQCSFNRNWIDISKANGTPDFDTWRIDLLFRM